MHACKALPQRLAFESHFGPAFDLGYVSDQVAHLADASPLIWNFFKHVTERLIAVSFVS